MVGYSIFPDIMRITKAVPSLGSVCRWAEHKTIGEHSVVLGSDDETRGTDE